MINFAEIFFNAADNHLARTDILQDKWDNQSPIYDLNMRPVFSCDAIGESIDKITNTNGYGFHEDYWKLKIITEQYVYSFGLNPESFNGFKEFDAWEDRQDVRCAWLYLLGTVAEEENLWYDLDTAQLLEKIGEDYRPYQIPSQPDCFSNEDKEGR